MSKFAAQAKSKPPKAPMKTKKKLTTTYEGGTGYSKTAKTELFTAATSSLFGEPKFYETGDTSAQRLVDLVHKVTKKDPAFVAGMIPWLRNTANIRTTAYVMALEYAAAGGPSPRQVISGSMSRADEPAEALAYWLGRHGRQIPSGVKRGIADAATAMYTEYAVLKWGSARHGVRMADVIELTHPKPRADWQSDLFRFILDDRHHGRQNAVERAGKSLTMIRRHRAMSKMADNEKTALLADAENVEKAMQDAGFTWEDIGGWAPGGMTAQTWEAIIPNMGYMALLRNLRNFVEKGVSKKTLDTVAAKLADPDEVARSRQFPYRFWTAYRELGDSGSVRFQSALEDALQASMSNIPTFTGRTLVAIDTSQSMNSPVSQKSSVAMYEIAALFAAAVATRNGGDKVRVIEYATTSREVPVLLDALPMVQQTRGGLGKIGYGTNTWPSVNQHYQGEDRVIVFTDMQDHPTESRIQKKIPNVYVWDLMGYRTSNIDTGVPGRYLMSGFTDAAFRMITLLEMGRDADWPWMS